MATSPSWWVSTGELFDQRPGSPFDSTGKREYVRRFRVMVNDRTVDSVMVCLLSPDLPKPYEQYTNPTGTIADRLSVCTNLAAAPEHDDDWQSWIVTAKYSTRLRGAGTSGHPEKDKPWDEFPDVDWDYEEEQYAPQQDLDQKPIVNAAGDPFQPAPTRPIAFPVLVISRNEPSFNKDKAYQYAYRVNLKQFMGEPSGTVLLYPPKAKKVYKGQLQYWRVTYRLKFQNWTEPGRKDWQWFLLNCGMRQLRNVQVKILGAVQNLLLPCPVIENGHPVSHPVLLNAQGFKANRDANGKIKATYLKFRVIRAEDFSPLKLDQYV